jgi:hypothetical protein
MRPKSLILVLATSLAAIRCFQSNNTFDRLAVKSKIEALLKIQEEAYGDHSPEGKKKTRETCIDSLVFIGGDDGGMSVSADGYVNDLADGYIERPHDRQFQIYENMVIVTSVHQGYKLLSNDTLLLNSRSTKIFIRDGDSWKMAYVTYAPLPVLYSKVVKVADETLRNYEGEYRIDTTTLDKIEVHDHRLMSTIGGYESELRPINDSTFIGVGYFGKVVFVKNRMGVVTHYYFEWNDGQRIVFPKVK